MDTEALLKTLAELGATEAADALRELDPNDPITALVLSIVADAIERDGVDGLIAVKDLLTAKIEGEPLDHAALRSLSLRQRSDLISAYERDEAATNTKVRAVMAIVVNVLAKISGAVVGVLIK